MRDPLISNFLSYVVARHASTGYEDDMQAFAQRLGLKYSRSSHTFYDPLNRCVYLSYNAGGLAAREDIAHEIGHALALEGDKVNYEQLFRYYHASAPDIDAHLECIADIAADTALMPDWFVRQTLRLLGWTGAALWQLTGVRNVTIQRAIRRMVHFDEDANVVAFIAERGRVTCIEKAGHVWIPFWLGDELPDTKELEAAGVSLHSPDRYTVVGVLVAD